MARLRNVLDHECALPDPSGRWRRKESPRKTEALGNGTKGSLDLASQHTPPRSIKLYLTKRRQPFGAGAVRQVCQKIPGYEVRHSTSSTEKQDEESEKENQEAGVRRSPRKATKSLANAAHHTQYAISSTENSPAGSEESSFYGTSDISDSASSTASLGDRLRNFNPPSPSKKIGHHQTAKVRDALLPRQLFPTLPSLKPLQDQSPPRKASAHTAPPKALYSDQSLQDVHHDFSAILRFSPRSSSPHKYNHSKRLATPPNSPTKSRLQSPSKSKPRIPPSPHRPSLDAFWSAEVINDWHDLHSPRKPSEHCTLGFAFPIVEEDDSDPSPPSSPLKSHLKSPIKSPYKKDKAELLRKKDFEASKHGVADTFLKELDHRIASGRIAGFTAATGGIKIIWSKKLNSTAGRANWRRETLRPSLPSKSLCTSFSSSENSLLSSKEVIDLTLSPQKSIPTYRDHATIELATKVISTEYQLLNVLAHEFCHLCTFMISNVKNNPHGTEFKSWAKKASTIFADRGVDVTTKHSYEIEYRYIWLCAGPDGKGIKGCGAEFKRHSKSIDPVRQGCGKCKGKLVQIKPKPKPALQKKGGQVSEVGLDYRSFVKANYALTKASNPGLSMGEIMKEVARRFREEKENSKVRKDKDVVVDVREVGSTDTREKSDDDNDDGVGGLSRRIVDLTV